MGRGGKAPTEDSSLLLLAALTCSAGSLIEKVAMESPESIRLDRAPHAKYKNLGSKVDSVNRAMAHFPKVCQGNGQ